MGVARGRGEGWGYKEDWERLNERHEVGNLRMEKLGRGGEQRGGQPFNQP